MLSTAYSSDDEGAQRLEEFNEMVHQIAPMRAFIFKAKDAKSRADLVALLGAELEALFQLDRGKCFVSD